MDIGDLFISIQLCGQFAEADAELFKIFDKLKTMLPKSSGANPKVDILTRCLLLNELGTAASKMSELYGKLLTDLYPDVVVEEDK